MGLAASLASHPPKDTVGVDVETKIEIASPFAQRDGSVTLGVLLAAHPPEAGVVEVSPFSCQIAHNNGHIINRDAEEEILVPARNGNGHGGV